MSFEIIACPELVPPENTQCDVPGEITGRYVLESTDGPIEHIRTKCLAGHALNFPAYMLKDAAQANIAELPYDTL